MSEPGLVIDTSAIAAIVFGENDAERYADALSRHAGAVMIGAPTAVEAELVAHGRLGAPGAELMHAVLDRVSACVVTFDAALARIAVSAWERFGKGRHPAQLNLGDCYAYAVSKQLDLPLLFKGNDFSQTDVRSALT